MPAPLRPRHFAVAVPPRSVRYAPLKHALGLLSQIQHVLRSSTGGSKAYRARALASNAHTIRLLQAALRAPRHGGY